MEFKLISEERAECHSLRGVGPLAFFELSGRNRDHFMAPLTAF